MKLISWAINKINTKKYIGHQIVIGTRLRMKLGKKIVMGNRVFILNRVSRKDPTGKVRVQQRPEGAMGGSISGKGSKCKHPEVGMCLLI